MKYAILTALVAGMVLGAAPMTSNADQHKGSESKDRAQDQAHVQQQEMDRLHDKERIRQEERLRLEDEKIYGHKLMLSLIHISEPTRQESRSRMPSSA